MGPRPCVHLRKVLDRISLTRFDWPTGEIIYWETLHRWQTELGLSLNEIQKSNILEKPLRDSDFRRGLLWSLSQRCAVLRPPHRFSASALMTRILTATVPTGETLPTVSQITGLTMHLRRTIFTDVLRRSSAQFALPSTVWQITFVQPTVTASYLLPPVRITDVSSALIPKELIANVPPKVDNTALLRGDPCGNDCFLFQLDEDDESMVGNAFLGIIIRALILYTGFRPNDEC